MFRRCTLSQKAGVFAIKTNAVATVPSRRYYSIVSYGTVKTATQPRMLSLTPTILTLTLSLTLTG